jgi:hypothetical protein
MNAEALRPVSLKLDFAYQAEAAFKGALRALTSAENKVFEGRQASASRAGTPVRPNGKRRAGTLDRIETRHSANGSFGWG